MRFTRNLGWSRPPVPFTIRGMLVVREQEAPPVRIHTLIARCPSILPGRLACAAALALVLMMGWLAAPTPASATTMNHIWNYLRFPALSDANEDLRGCTVRTIVTGPGRFRWRIFSAHWATPRATAKPARAAPTARPLFVGGLLAPRRPPVGARVALEEPHPRRQRLAARRRHQGRVRPRELPHGQHTGQGSLIRRRRQPRPHLDGAME